MVRYRDISTNFDMHPVNGDTLALEDSAAISNSIRNLIFTDKYERFWNPSMGAGVPQTLFDNLNRDSMGLLEIRIKEVIQQWEPRAENIKVILRADESSSNELECAIIYTPVNSLIPITINSILKRVR